MRYAQAMKAVKRLSIVVGVIAVLGVLLEIALRIIIPPLVETGARIGFRVPDSAQVTVETKGSMLFNALRWRISDVTVTAEDVPLSNTIQAETELKIGSLPLIPTFGSLQNGNATFTVEPEQLESIIALGSQGLAQTGEMRDGKIAVTGTLSEEDFALPAAPVFEAPFELVFGLSVADGDLVVTPEAVHVQADGPLGEFLSEAMSAQRAVCMKEQLPTGLTLTDVSVDAEGRTTLHAALSPGLISDPDDRRLGNCG